MINGWVQGSSNLRNTNFSVNSPACSGQEEQTIAVGGCMRQVLTWPWWTEKVAYGFPRNVLVSLLAKAVHGSLAFWRKPFGLAWPDVMIQFWPTTCNHWKYQQTTIPFKDPTCCTYTQPDICRMTTWCIDICIQRKQESGSDQCTVAWLGFWTTIVNNKQQ